MLEILNTPVTNLRFLSGCAKLRELKLVGIEVGDLSPLLSVATLKELRLIGSPVVDRGTIERLREKGVIVEYTGHPSE